jgi:hypothetical protein
MGWRCWDGGDRWFVGRIGGKGLGWGFENYRRHWRGAQAWMHTIASLRYNADEACSGYMKGQRYIGHEIVAPGLELLLYSSLSTCVYCS